MVQGPREGAADADKRRSDVSEYYGETLKSTEDLRTSACCPIDSAPEAHRAILERIHPGVLSRFYGCGSPVPDSIEGACLLDLGCGTGRDAYLASALVGVDGRVIGVDMTDAALEIAEHYKAYHADVLLDGAAESNVDFRKGIIEDLAAAGVGDGSVDVVISNCVCNLCTDKKLVWSEVSRVLREGGEFYFSDVYADRRLSAEAASHEVLIGECLGGALYVEDFRRIMAEVGFSDIRVVSCGSVVVTDPELLPLVADVKFYSITVRAFKISTLEDRRENYGQVATYNAISGSLTLDDDFTFPAGVPVPVDGNTAAILQKSRYAKRFTVSEPGAHLGIFTKHSGGGTLQAAIRKFSASDSAACCKPAEDVIDPVDPPTVPTASNCCGSVDTAENVVSSESATTEK